MAYPITHESLKGGGYRVIPSVRLVHEHDSIIIRDGKFMSDEGRVIDPDSVAPWVWKEIDNLKPHRRTALKVDELRGTTAKKATK